MKLTEKQKNRVIEVVAKKHNLTTESFLMRIFKKKLSKALKNDKSLMKTIQDGDKMVADLKKGVRDMQKKGYPIPSNLKKYLNTKYD